jgi:hypothetical protein
MTVLDSWSRDRFVDRLTGFLREHSKLQSTVHSCTVPDNDVDLIRMLDSYLDRAGSYGITSQRGLAAYAALALFFSAQFDQIPRFQAFLIDESIDPETRILRIFELIVDAEALRAAQGW